MNANVNNFLEKIEEKIKGFSTVSAKKIILENLDNQIHEIQKLFDKDGQKTHIENLKIIANVNDYIEPKHTIKAHAILESARIHHSYNSKQDTY